MLVYQRVKLLNQGVQHWELGITEVCVFSFLPSIDEQFHWSIQKWTTLLRVIPYPDRLFWHSLHYICKYIWNMFWHSTWHCFWHMLWHNFWHSFWHSTWHLFWHSLWHLFWHIFWHSLWHSFWQSIWHSIWDIYIYIFIYLFILYYIYVIYIYIYSVILFGTFFLVVRACPARSRARNGFGSVPRLHRSAAAASGSRERPEMPRRPMTHVKNMTSEESEMREARHQAPQGRSRGTNAICNLAGSVSHSCSCNILGC